MELGQVNELFNVGYKLYKKFSRTELSDGDLNEYTRCVSLIYRRYNTAFAKEVLMAITHEIDRLERTKHPVGKE